MQVTIKGLEQNIRVQTITLQPEKDDTLNLYAFHCLNCGNFHQKIGGKVSKIYPIYEPSEQVPVVSKCRNCGAEWTFQTHDGYATDKVKVVLSPALDKAVSHFYCYRGKDLLLDYSLEEIYAPRENKRKTPPFAITCEHEGCNMTYLISDLF